MPIAGLLYWLVVAYLLRSLPQRSAILWSFIGTGAVFPVGLLITRLVGGNLFAKSERLTSLGLLFNGLQLFFWPIIVVVWRAEPEWTPFTMATLFGSHFLGYGWLYRSRGYAVLIARDPLYLQVPLLAAAVYAVAVVLLTLEVRRDG
jgi:hypothetical protein